MNSKDTYHWYSFSSKGNNLNYLKFFFPRVLWNKVQELIFCFVWKQNKTWIYAYIFRWYSTELLRFSKKNLNKGHTWPSSLLLYWWMMSCIFRRGANSIWIIFQTLCMSKCSFHCPSVHRFINHKHRIESSNCSFFKGC